MLVDGIFTMEGCGSAVNTQELFVRLLLVGCKRAKFTCNTFFLRPHLTEER